MFKWLMQRWNGSSRFGDTIIIVFIMFQVLDGAFTYWGVSTGLSPEGNPIVRATISSLGVGTGLFFWKMFGAFCGVFIHLKGAHRYLALLTFIYLVCGIMPWSYFFLTY